MACSTNLHGATSRNCRCPHSGHSLRCRQPGCTTHTTNIYCLNHICLFLDCQLPRNIDSPYCTDHNLTAPTYDSPSPPPSPILHRKGSFFVLHPEYAHLMGDKAPVPPAPALTSVPPPPKCHRNGCTGVPLAHNGFCQKHQLCMHYGCYNFCDYTRIGLCRRHEREYAEAETLAKHWTPTLGVRHIIVKGRSEAKKRRQHVKRALKFKF